MSKWITDRLPDKKDASAEGYVWRWSPFRERAVICVYKAVIDGEAWHPMIQPEPYEGSKDAGTAKT